MKNIYFPLMLLLLSTLFTSCDVIGSIFKTGVGVGIVIAVVILVILYFIFRKKA